MPSRSRLVTSTTSRGQRRSRLSTSRAHASSRCSALSSSSNCCRDASHSTTVSARSFPACSWTARAFATAWTMSVESLKRSQLHEPDTIRIRDPAASPATCSASRVLPQPPAPVSVSNRVEASNCLICAISLPRPMKLVSCCGRLCCGPDGVAGSCTGTTCEREPIPLSGNGLRSRPHPAPCAAPRCAPARCSLRRSPCPRPAASTRPW